MDYILVGKIITTHNLNGELKILSSFKLKDQVFKVNNDIFIGELYEKHKILSYRTHKNYDMVIFDEIDNIDKAIKYKQKNIYVLRNTLVINNYLDTDLINLEAYYNDKLIGVVKDIVDMGNNNLVMVINNKYIPKCDNFILKVDLENKKIYLKNVEGLL